MSLSYSIEPISPAAVDRAYPLIRIIAPELALPQWRQYCKELALRGEEVILATNAQRYVKGLSIYSIRSHQTYGLLLDVPVLVVTSAADSGGVMSGLLRHLHVVCGAAVCAGMRFWSSDDEIWRRRLEEEHIGRTDVGLFVPAGGTIAQIEQVLAVELGLDPTRR